MLSGTRRLSCCGIAFSLVLVGTTPGLAADRPETRKPAAARPDKPLSSRPRVAVTISKETTYITGPLRKDGYVDYVAALNERCRQGVTAENNASVLFWKAIGPGEIPERYREQFFKMLGIPPLAERGHYLVTFDKHVKGLQVAANFAPNPQEPDEVTKQYDEARKGPWSAKEFPLVAGWLAANERPLALLTEATKRPRRYDPLVCGERDLIIAVLLPAVTLHREAARDLLARAMLRMGEGKAEAAWEDLLSCHRLARRMGQGPTLIDALVAITIDGIACSGDQAFLRFFRLTASQAARMRHELDRLPPISKMTDAIDFWERFMYLDSVSMMAREGPTALQRLEDGSPAGKPPGETKTLIDLAAGAAFDWDEILRFGNSWYDRMTDAFRRPTRAERKAALSKIDEDFRNLAKKNKDTVSLALSVLRNPRRAVSRQIGAVLVALLLPAASRAADAEDRGAMQFELVRLAFALAAYRADHGSYPEKLGDLAPKYVAQVPKDLFTAADLHYRREGAGYVLYSVGCNGKDDGGKSYEDRNEGNQDCDDLVVRVPGPTMESKK